MAAVVAWPRVGRMKIVALARMMRAKGLTQAKIAETLGVTERQACLRPRDRFWDIPVPKIDSAFDNLLVPQPSWSP
ncbi:hypothetical protein, partial [Thiolapillus sp.]|uniref:hypothetical protein n=1 Tax=Thiolapillus sp. TaxID=2017437 RepID=UPI0025FD5658